MTYEEIDKYEILVKVSDGIRTRWKKVAQCGTIDYARVLADEQRDGGKEAVIKKISFVKF